MGFNDLMHPRNIYRKAPPDFKLLAEKFDYFRKFTKETKSGHLTLNFKDPEALRALTCALLEHDFGLKLSIPLDRLIPTVPLRLNYILWIEDLLSCLPGVFSHATVRGFDIGSGASCIYPLLGAKLNNWHFLATEVDESSVSFAKENVKSNGLENHIQVKQVNHSSFLKIPLEDEENKEFDFCMCNPPFFVSEFEASHGIARSDKRPQPSGVCTGTESETVTGGGEVEFVKEIIKDSLSLKEHISWYTTMLGKKSSSTAILAYLKENNIKTVTTTEFCQGHTMRWGVAWSFLPDVVVQDSPSKRRKRAKKAKPLQLIIPAEFVAVQPGSDEQFQASERVNAVVNYVKKTLNKLKVTMEEQDKAGNSCLAFHCHASEKTWAHQRRKRREKLRESAGQENAGESQSCSVDETTKQVADDALNDMKTEDALEEDNTNTKTILKADEVASGSGVSKGPDFGSDECPSHSSDPQQGDTVARPLLSFTVRVGTGTQVASDMPRDSVVLEMTWIDGQDKNDLYQLYQFFQNKLLKGL